MKCAFADLLANYVAEYKFTIISHCKARKMYVLSIEEIKEIFNDMFDLIVTGDGNFYLNNSLSPIYKVKPSNLKILFFEYLSTILHLSKLATLTWHYQIPLIEIPHTLEELEVSTTTHLNTKIIENLEILGLFLTNIEEIKLLPHVVDNYIPMILIRAPYEHMKTNNYAMEYEKIINELPTDYLTFGEYDIELKAMLDKIFVPYSERCQNLLIKSAQKI